MKSFRIRGHLSAVLGGAMALGVMVPAAAQAKPLFSVWKLESTTPTGARNVDFENVILEQRLLPMKAVELAADATTDSGKVVAAGTALFLVLQQDGQRAYCTVKDRSLGNAAKSLFIPALDKRPCFVDADGDGAFEASFNVFDKYGSALAPSGNLKKATPLASVAPYREIASSDFPSPFRFSYRLDGKREAEKARVDVSLDNGSGKLEPGMARSERDGNALKTMNATFRFVSIEGDSASIVIETDDRSYLIGNSSGSFGLFETIPDFLGG